MLCRLNRWLISRAEDTGKALPRFAGRHVRRCPACGEFARAAATLSSRLRTERPEWLAKVPDFTVDLGAEAMPLPVPQAGARELRRPWLFLRPLPVAAVALVLAGAFLLFQVVLKKPSPTAEERAAALAALKTITAAPQGLEGVIVEAESPLDRERKILEKSVSSAVEYLQARLNIKIERREPPPAKSS